MRSVLFYFVLCFFVFMGGCLENFDGGSTPKEKFERAVTLSEPLGAGKELDAETVNGGVTVKGVDIEQCDITATLETRGDTVQEAEELSGKIELKLEKSDKGLVFRIEKPQNVKHNRVCVKLDVTTPIETDLVLGSVNGNIVINNIEGDLTAKTVNGNLTTHGQFGKVRASTVNGTIECDKISSDADVSTVNGSVKARLDESNNVCNIKISTVNGGIDLDVSDGLSAKVHASVLNGSVHSDVPVTVQGKISKKNLKGTIGDGKGRLRLSTVNGSINIR